MNDTQVYTLSRLRHAEMIAEAEAWRGVPKHPGASRRWAARFLHGLADRIGPAPARGYDRRATPYRPTAV
ncbi:hypothetical protein [Streptosporangium roseum]|uniref:Uncharacterized protein n=1 Tax=Streptosporangium roseum (strain ATCC 12428 / DSM 43021 / JCM 3005 / KCTC 9067 / NCIMB 10171 / NRRL 2505 / NI 9100) TaxID=479432 RepID=D2ARC8_STRRD|nr:hypothetical protein [Streptosporangium roseum]ACZ90268.1 hypothetical protein Sros_7594 [Streptosporangium roseum DSM 43021]